MRHRYECQLRRADLHGDGNVGNVFFVDYVQDARLDLLRQLGTSPTPNPGEGLVVVRTVLETLRPLRLEDAPLSVEAWVCEVRAASFTVGYELTTKAGLHARATTSLAPYVFGTGRPRRISAAERDLLARFTDAPPLGDPRRERPAPWTGAEHSRPIQVRFSDVDLLGHVNNVRYFDYVHEGNVEVLMDVFQEARIEGTVSTVVVRQEMDHVGQLSLRPEPYVVWSRVAAVGRTSVTLEAEVRDGTQVMARTRVIEVNVDPDGAATPWHVRHRELFEARSRGLADLGEQRIGPSG